MDDKDELRRRRQAIRLWLKGVSPNQILQRVQRGRTWFGKWRDRFERWGAGGLRSQSRRPRHRPAAHSTQMVRLIVRTRQRLGRERVGLIGPRAIRRELRALRLGKRLPSLATIKRVLKAKGLTASPPVETTVYRPLPLAHLSGGLQAMDWTCRYLEGGAKVYAFHTLNLHTRACSQTIAADKSTATVIQHALQTWKSLGIPTFLQLDNDAAFNGGYKGLRSICTSGTVRRHRADFLAGRRTRMQRRHRTIQPALVTRLLRPPALRDGGNVSTRQPNLRAVVPDPIRAAQTGRPHASTRPPRRRSASPANRTANRPVSKTAADHGWPRAFHSAGRSRWHYRTAQRNLACRPAVGQQICLGDRHHAFPPLGHLVSALRPASVAPAQIRRLRPVRDCSSPSTRIPPVSGRRFVRDVVSLFRLIQVVKNCSRCHEP